MSELEKVARAIWERRRAFVHETMPDLGMLEEWGDGSVPRSNGVFEEARAAVAAMRFDDVTPSQAFIAGYGWGGHGEPGYPGDHAVFNKVIDNLLGVLPSERSAAAHT